MSSIILTDPVNLNTPYGKMFVSMFHGAMAQTNLTDIYGQSRIVRWFRITKHANHLLNNFDWYEWSIDTAFMQKYKNNLILVIGKKDVLLSVNTTSYAMTQICRVIYTNTQHGFVLFTNFMKQIQPFEGVEPDL